jgi:hypothetical protein
VLDDIRTVALTHQCAACQKSLLTQHLVVASYWADVVRDFALQIDIGIIGAGVRNVWIHFDCAKPLITSWAMTPDIHSCIRCRKNIDRHDLIQPVFQVIDAKAVNPNDYTDVGIALNDRVYFMHSDCKNTTLAGGSSSILFGGI